MRLVKVVILLSTVVLLGCTQSESATNAEVLKLMEQSQFDAAIIKLKPKTGWFSRDAKANYMMAVALIRKEDPEITRSKKYKNKAESLGYEVPLWYDNYAVKLENQ